ncbi:hypothetical protein GCM10022221_06140 [Actinocorallia aurea]
MIPYGLLGTFLLTSYVLVLALLLITCAIRDRLTPKGRHHHLPEAPKLLAPTAETPRSAPAHPEESPPALVPPVPARPPHPGDRLVAPTLRSRSLPAPATTRTVPPTRAPSPLITRPDLTSPPCSSSSPRPVCPAHPAPHPSTAPGPGRRRTLAA